MIYFCNKGEKIAEAEEQDENRKNGNAERIYRRDRRRVNRERTELPSLVGGIFPASAGGEWRRRRRGGGGGAAGTGRRGNESLCKDIQRAFLSEFRTFIFSLIPNMINSNRPRSAAERLIKPRFMSILTPKNTREKVQHVSRLLERGKKV